MLIDFHTHAFPAKIADRAVDSLESSSGTKAAIGGTCEDLLASMRKNGVDYSVVLPIVSKPSQTMSVFHYACALQKIEGLIPFGSVHPFSGTVKEDLQAISGMGFPGVKFHPDFQGVFLDDSSMIRAMSFAAEQGLIILIHAGEDISYPDLHRSTPRRLLNVLDSLKGATIVCAHTGGWKYWDDVEHLLMDRGLYIDTSYTYGWCEEEQMARILSNWDADKILFGSDSPWAPQENAAKQLKTLGLPEELLEKIYYGNALRLLGMESVLQGE